ncbi:MAG: glycosyl hydrolase family 17 [Saprospiraceae bacterium]|nr:glycosyl hydrolase family 17 [Saprospiraceae bacterium]
MQKIMSLVVSIVPGILLLLLFSCNHHLTTSSTSRSKSTSEILGNQKYLAISYSGYRHLSRDTQPSIAELKEDIKLLSAMGIKLLKTYNVQFAEAGNILKAITEIKKENPDFEMYVMLGAWIDCKNAWTASPVHSQESDKNSGEIERVIVLANQYPDIVKMITVGNEAMVKWASGYFVEPDIILNWVNHLQDLKKKGGLHKEIWITSSDNFASWGGGGSEYHVEALNKLIKAVDFISMHTYPMLDTHYNPDFWGVRMEEENMSDKKKIDAAMIRARNYAIAQYDGVVKYMKSTHVEKPIHIGETGWASVSNEQYGDTGSRAVDEYKSALYFKAMRKWTNEKGMSCFYFEAFDEQWKNAANPSDSENHFGLINLAGQAKYAIWDMVDAGVFKGLERDGKPITKTYGGSLDSLMKNVKVPPTEMEIKDRKKSGKNY